MAQLSVAKFEVNGADIFPDKPPNPLYQSGQMDAELDTQWIGLNFLAFNMARPVESNDHKHATLPMLTSVEAHFPKQYPKGTYTAKLSEAVFDATFRVYATPEQAGSKLVKTFELTMHAVKVTPSGPESGDWFGLFEIDTVYAGQAKAELSKLVQLNVQGQMIAEATFSYAG